MKRLYYLILLLVALGTSVGCGQKGIIKSDPTDERIAAHSNIEFGINLLKDVATIERHSKEDIIISPLSASMALGMLAVGAQGETREQILNTLGLPGFNDQEVISYYQYLYNSFFLESDIARLSIANAIWTLLPLKTGFIKTTERGFNAEIEHLDFSNPKIAAAYINQWTSKKTNNLISEIVDEKDLVGTYVVLENALYFNSPWDSYNQYRLCNKTFTTIDGDKISRSFFTNNREPNLFYSDDSVSVVRIPYNRHFSFTVALPKIAFDDFIRTINSDKWNYWRSHSNSISIELTIPCFKKDYKMDETFKNVLRKQGMVLPFCPAAEFSKMLDLKIYISKIIQKCAIGVNEKGTEAAAATAAIANIGLDLSPVPVFIADHPFIFAVENRQTGDLLMIGTHCY